MGGSGLIGYKRSPMIPHGGGGDSEKGAGEGKAAWRDLHRIRFRKGKHSRRLMEGR